MEETKYFLDYEGLTEYHKELKTDIKTDIHNEVSTQMSDFISYTDDTTFEALEEAV